MILWLVWMMLQTPPVQSGGSVAPPTQSIPSIEVTRLFPKMPLIRPVQAVQAPGDSRHLYVVEQAGRILKLDFNTPESSTPVVWLDIRKQVHDQGNEEGLLSMVFHPKFAENGEFFVYYTANTPPRSELTRFVVDHASGNPRVESAEVLLAGRQPYANHNGGTVLFGPDGMLYLSLGDGGAANDPHHNGQDLGKLLAKVLRINVDVREGGKPYGIPADNPFVATPSARPEVWAYGFRNVWRMSFDRATGRLFAGDVGEASFEEINIIEKGGNYGWNPREGRHAFRSGKPGSFGSTYIDPVAEYSHSEGLSVTGGYVYRGSKHPSLQGVYLYADYAYGTMWGMRCNESGCGASEVVWRQSGQPHHWTSFGELLDGELVLCAFDSESSGTGSLWKMSAKP